MPGKGFVPGEHLWARIMAVVHYVENMIRNPHPREPRRPVWRSGGGQFRFGTLSASISAGQLEPVAVNEIVYDDSETTPVVAIPRSTGETFPAINAHNVNLESGVFVSCAPGTGTISVIVQADCPETAPPPPPPPPCEGDPPACPPGQHAECISGQWQCVDDGPPPPPPPPPPEECDPASMPICFFGYHPECINGQWECVPDGA